jgi:hypothetical protein
MSQEKVDLSNLNKPAVNPEEVVPVDIVPLPSKGLVYPLGSPLANQQVVSIRAMTAREEDILTSKALLKQGKAVDMLLKSCILGGMDVDDMVTGDRNAALVAIRITGYGDDYAVDVVCPQCEKKSEHTFSLSQFPVNALSVDPIQSNMNAFEFTLPFSNKRIIFKLMTGKDENEVRTILDRSKKFSVVESAVTTRLFQQILSIDGETDRAKTMNLIKNMRAQDSRALRQHVDKMTPGIEMKQEFTCPECDETSNVEVPMGTEFFWPRA